MIDTDVIDSLDVIKQKYARSALAMLYDSGVIDAQRSRNKSRLLAGNANDSVDDVATQVLNYRKQDQQLSALLEASRKIKEQLLKDNSHA